MILPLVALVAFGPALGVPLPPSVPFPLDGPATTAVAAWALAPEGAEGSVAPDSRAATAGPVTQAATHFRDCGAPTATSATVLFPPGTGVGYGGGRLEPGDELAVVAPDGTCVGVGVWEHDGLAISVWADDPLTPVLDGLRPGDPLEFLAYDASARAVLDGEGLQIRFEGAYGADEGFVPDGLYVASEPPPRSTSNEPGTDAALFVGPVAPNPMAGRGRVDVRVPYGGRVTADVFDALGRRVSSVYDADVVPGAELTFGLGGSALAPGAYVLLVRSAAEAQSRPFVVGF